VRETNGGERLTNDDMFNSLAREMMPPGFETVNNLFLMQEVFRDTLIVEIS
jgi:hypothetical protein